LINISQQHRNSNIIIGGDFNFDFSQPSPLQNKLTSIFDEHELTPQIDIPTRKSTTTATCIDNILTNLTSLHVAVITTTISDHFAPICYIKTKKEEKVRTITKRKINDKAINMMKKALLNKKWDLDGPDAFQNFECSIREIFNLCCPLTTCPVNKNFHKLEQWITKGLLTSRRRKHALRKEVALGKSDCLIYKKYLKLYNKLIREAKRVWYAEAINESWGNGRKIWNLVNEATNRNKQKESLPTEMIDSDTKFTGKEEIANKFNQFYTEIGPNLANKICSNTSYTDYLKTPAQSKLKLQQINEEELENIFKDLKPKRSAGYDEISNHLLKTLQQEISKPLLYLVNRSISQGIVPDFWKMAKIIPIHKKGDKKDFGNYRPISLLPTISKILEKVVTKQLNQYLEDNNLLHNLQFGFRKKHETTHALLKFTELIYKASARKELTVSIFADLKKAFDTVNHQILLDKMRYYGIDTKWFTSYLSNRTQFTQIDSTISSKTTITCGVPQGSILGPILFLIYINDLPVASEFTSILFADDTTLLMHGKDAKSLEIRANKEIAKAAEWFKSNKLTLHAGKTMFMAFNTKEDIQINIDKHNLMRLAENRNEKTIKFVGVLIDENLNWRHHTEHVCTKLNKIKYLMSKAKNILPTSIKLLLYNSLAKPHIDFSSTIWGGAAKTHLKNLETIQKKLVRLIVNAKSRAHTENIFKKLEILKLEDQIQLNNAKLGYKFYHQDLPPPILEIYKLRHKTSTRQGESKFTIEAPIINFKKQHLHLDYIPSTWNSLNDSLKELHIKSFQSNIKLEKFQSYSDDPCNNDKCFSCN
ncbi:MAG: RNA-directed DNA polymerase, partial [Flavobacteriaceae bacterium]|nr:RNA-directed DNA polymerase [Flavobacteriaceae bacterium]